MRLWDLAMAMRPVELLLMVAIFVGIAWRAFAPRRRREHEEHAMIPLRDTRDEEG